MNDLKMVLECKCGQVLEFDTNECDIFICPKCGETVFEKIEDPVEHHKSLKGGNLNES